MNVQQDWRTLPAGAALDILIARYKGWRIVEESGNWIRVFEPDGSSHFRENDSWGGKVPAYYLEDLWGYSVELDEAFKLLDEIHIPYAWEMSRQDVNRLFVVQIELRWPVGNKAGVFNAFAGPEVVAVERAERPAHAIAKAYYSWKVQTNGRP